MKRLLIVKLDGIGDYVLIHNYIDLLFREGTFSGWHVTMLCNEIWASLVYTLLPDVNCVPLDIRQYEKNYWYRFSLEQKLNAEAFDVVIHPVYSRCAWVDLLIEGIHSGRKIGFVGDTSNMTEEDKKYTDSFYHELIETGSGRQFEFDRNRVFFESVTGISSFPSNPVIRVCSEEVLTPPFRDYAVMVIGAADTKRKWHPKYYARLGQQLRDDYGMPLVLCGGPTEVNESIIIERALGQACINLVGATSLADMLGILIASTIVIGNDTGLLHLAVALEKQAVVISNGNHLHRFVPYSELSDRYRCALPFDMFTLSEADLNAYYAGSDIDINTISVEEAYCQVSALLGPLKSCSTSATVHSRHPFRAYSASAEMFYRHNGKMLQFVERIKSQHERVMVYGFSSLGQILAALLDSVFVGYVDLCAMKLKSAADGELLVYPPEQLAEQSFDVILISLLGREDTIEALLIEQVGIAQNKVLRVDI
ncbi:glycosyltransferase family 9 protein [Aeromonas hydrophila]|uniref:glycosyltransferase family 9 protein n=1 Tax=Aeromonas hydrophila TaxID=644 RepID=UPI0023655A2D|nr:glycosyltransferase family 9 protein [Aeromonas hydrophila]WDF89779.1 glycosyltransferase family 9 protein [Aeromonas hydrophila subsp. hydrophila]